MQKMGSVKSLTCVIMLKWVAMMATRCSGRRVRRKNERKSEDVKERLREVGLIY